MIICKNNINLYSIGVIKLRIPNLAEVGGRICFNERLPLTLFRTKVCDVWKYLERKNRANQNTPDQQPRLSYVQKPENQKDKGNRKSLATKDIDTTRVRICFQVGGGEFNCFNLSYH